MKTKVLLTVVLIASVLDAYSQFKVNSNGSAQFKVGSYSAGFNSFTEQTEIRYTLPDNVRTASVCIFDMQGKMLKKLNVSPSEQTLIIRGSELKAGTYLYALIADGKKVDMKRMILTK